MSKNPRERPVPPPKSPPPPADTPPEGTPTGDPLPLLIVMLTNVDAAVLGDCAEGEPVTIRWDETPLTVTTVAGVCLGDVGAGDVDKVRQRQSNQGVIAAMDIEAVLCSVGVL